MLVALCGPIIYFNRVKSNSEKKALKQLNDYAAAHKGTLGEHDIWGKTVIGIYKDAGRLLYFTKEGEKTEINLHEVKRCRVVEVKNEEKTSVVKLELVVSYKDPTAKETALVFYDAQRSNFLLSGELQLVKKWHDLVNSIVA